jgi:hypothetical protein
MHRNQFIQQFVYCCMVKPAHWYVHHTSRGIFPYTYQYPLFLINCSCISSTNEGQTIPVSLIQQSMMWNACMFGCLHWVYSQHPTLQLLHHSHWLHRELSAFGTSLECVAVHLNQWFRYQLQHWKNSSWQCIQFTLNEWMSQATECCITVYMTQVKLLLNGKCGSDIHQADIDTVHSKL